ncbi:hypothetical protein H7H82_13255 [Mycobacterium heidelbergense]|uniref:hypothetical protein n=1 Tax=Mycobacterium heidelbergense TaxID=53376 RepID=UPI0021F31163|nr:hypothetical protein [Mycobacterium heidelbergense]MCV7051547.1 hypothetical protein [Mycobacterium heidelbergense]
MHGAAGSAHRRQLARPSQLRACMTDHFVYVVTTGQSSIEFDIDSVWTTQSAAEARFKEIVLTRFLFFEPVTLQKWPLNAPDGGAFVTEICSLCWSTVSDDCVIEELVDELIERSRASR